MYVHKRTQHVLFFFHWPTKRYLQSQAEVRKLHVVKEELGRLDCLVTQDVSILRDRIEEANRDYNAARYTHK